MPVADSEMVVDNSHALYEGKTPNSDGNDCILPASLCSPAADILKNFYHTKRVGNYLIGRKLGEGSFAKVREGLHALTGEKVSISILRPLQSGNVTINSLLKLWIIYDFTLNEMHLVTRTHAFKGNRTVVGLSLISCRLHIFYDTY